MTSAFLQTYDTEHSQQQLHTTSALSRKPTTASQQNDVQAKHSVVALTEDTQGDISFTSCSIDKAATLIKDVQQGGRWVYG